MDLGSVGGSIVKQSIERLRSTLLSTSSLLPTLNLARQSVFSSLSKIKDGTLTIVLPDGDKKVFGTLHNGPSATVVVHKDSFWMRILLSADLGFAESYMLNEVSCSDLLEFFEIMILNQKRLSNLSTNVSTIFAAATNMVMETVDASTVSRAQLNIAAHYDLSNDMFEGFLSPEMSYSCPIWLSRTEDGYKTDTLEKAQFRKLDHIIGELKIQSTDHVLEVGSGWGGFSIRAASTTGCRVTTLTLSIAQKQLAEERIVAAGLSDKVQVLLCDYRTLPIPDVLFDKFVAIEMMECSAEADLEVFFRRIDQLLKPDGGICYIQSTTMPDTRYANNFPKGEGFIPKYIFPGGHLASPTRIIAAVKKGAKDRFDIDSITNYGSHYVKCLRLWKEQFKLNFKSKIVPSLQLRYPSLCAADVEIFRRKYIYYFTYCEAGFRTKMLHITHMVLSRQGTTALHNDVEF